MGDFEDALANAPAITSLHFDFREDGALDERIGTLANLVELQLREVPPDLVLPEALLALPRLSHLGMTGKDDRLVVPELVSRLHLERLDVWDVRAGELPPLPSLRHLEIVVEDPKTEVAILAERFNHLEHLEVWGSHLPAGELPDDIERFSRLVTLRLISCGVSTLPDSLARLRALRTFGIRGCPMTEVPEVLARMPELAVLELAGELVGLPPSLAAMTGLRELHLGRALNKGAMLSRWDDVSKLKALPRVLGELVGLEKLDLDCCGVTDIAALRRLAKLRWLSLEWSGVEDVTPLGELVALEELSLANSDRIRDLRPLRALQKLRRLNLDNTRPASLDVLRELPALRELHIESIEVKRLDVVYELDVDLHADDEVKARYAGRGVIRSLPSLDELVARLGERDVAVVEAAFAQLAAWATAASTRDTNALAVLGVPVRIDDDDDDDDGGSVHARGYLPAIDLALDRHLAVLSPGVLATLFGALFHAVGDDFSAATRVAKELVSRSSGDFDAAQLAMIDGFFAASEYYDAGHRAQEETVHDIVLDEVFPLLRGPALAKLLAWCAPDHLDDFSGDGMSRLFAPALERARGEDLATVLTKLEAYFARCMESEPREVATLLAACDAAPSEVRDALAPMRARVDAWQAATAARVRLNERLADPRTAVAAFAEIADYSKDQLAALRRGLSDAGNIEPLPAELFEPLVRAWLVLDETSEIVRLVSLTAQARHVPDVRRVLDASVSDPAARGSLVRSAVLYSIRHEVPAATIDDLRALATKYDGLPSDVARAHEVRALLFCGARDHETEEFAAGVHLLATLDRYELPVVLDDNDQDDDAFEYGTAEDLATMVASHAESGEYELLHVLARHVAKLGITGRHLERMLAQLIAVCMVGDDPEGLPHLLPLVPATVTWDILAFNLACHSARSSDRAATFTHTRRALELGKSPDQFLGDSDFEHLHEDPEFVALLDSFR